MVLAVAHPRASTTSYLSPQFLTSGVYHFLSLSAVSHQFSQRPSCHLAFFPLSSFSFLLSLPLTHRSPRPRSETPLLSADLLLSLLLSPFLRNSALVSVYFGPSSLSSIPRARTTFLTPTPIICRSCCCSCPLSLRTLVPLRMMPALEGEDAFEKRKKERKQTTQGMPLNRLFFCRLNSSFCRGIDMVA